jgi:hypothetical protein
MLLKIGLINWPNKLIAPSKIFQNFYGMIFPEAMQSECFSAMHALLSKHYLDSLYRPRGGGITPFEVALFRSRDSLK